MRKELQQGLFQLLRSALTGQAELLPQSFCLAELKELVYRQQIVPLVYYGALNCGIDREDETMCQMFRTLGKAISVSESQLLETQRLFAAFEREGIDYMPLKGLTMCARYPMEAMRTMSDVDVLIRVAQSAKIQPLMRKLGYRFVIESDHECVWDLPTLHLELHKRLVPSYNRDFYTYYGDGWNRLSRVGDTCRYAFTQEDELIYLFAHLAKHYRDGGIGVKHFIDLWVYRRSNPLLDEDYLLAELKKLQLDAFYRNVLSTIAVWLEDAPETDITRLITLFVLNSGAYGSAEAQLLSSAAKISNGSAKKSRRIHLLQLLFWPYPQMCKKHPILIKWPIFLPFLWVARGFSALFKPGKTAKLRRELQTITPESVDHYRMAMAAVGLHFPKGEA